jgi:hypothetical protein
MIIDSPLICNMRLLTYDLPIGSELELEMQPVGDFADMFPARKVTAVSTENVSLGGLLVIHDSYEGHDVWSGEVNVASCSKIAGIDARTNKLLRPKSPQLFPGLIGAGGFVVVNTIVGGFRSPSESRLFLPLKWSGYVLNGQDMFAQ